MHKNLNEQIYSFFQALLIPSFDFFSKFTILKWTGIVLQLIFMLIYNLFNRWLIVNIDFFNYRPKWVWDFAFTWSIRLLDAEQFFILRKRNKDGFRSSFHEKQTEWILNWSGPKSCDFFSHGTCQERHRGCLPVA